MKSLQQFIKDFFTNEGHHVFLSLLIAKICGFLGSLFIIHLLSESDFGRVSIVSSVFFIFLAFSGFGSQQILLRYGSVAQDLEEKNALSSYLFRKGFFYQLLLSVLFFIVSVFYITRYEDIFFIFLLFNIRLIGSYFLIHIQCEFRISGKNKDFATVSNAVNILGLILLFVLSKYFGLNGYLFAIAFTPFVSLFWLKKSPKSITLKSFRFKKKELWNFGILAGGSALLSDMLFSADVLLLSFLMTETAVANYKVAILIPSNITFLAATFMQTDYSLLAKNSKNKSFLKNYILNFYKIFVPVSAVIFLVGFIFKTKIISFFFSEKYSGNEMVFAVLLAGFSLNMLLRNLYGTLISAVGLMKFNTFISLLNIIFLVIFAFIFVNKLGILGMAVSLSLSMFLSGILFLISFHLYWKTLK
ncbi:oligosaccharide flippase family protein [Halpernia frigidisoli]|uniref:Membrane protein involved in the export of O-antigen and teichoic acid n=1 Tax=Halpernia frigidisoli TaxID=1125876 RepID=A0A1I3I228_9FLAO|nr:oligosaccharide flippase family protein [Halpernia frigidisoli]SFI42065.1 Membrane protein involved in the export of O-antigen and teichoic acid [Halpernia frigidisoli]